MNETPNKAAQALGRLGKGKAKSITPEERERRRSHMRMIQSKRWPVKGETMEGTMIRTDGLNNPLSPNSGLGCNWGAVAAKAEVNAAVASYRTDAGITISWVDGSEDHFTDPQAALIALRENA